MVGGSCESRIGAVVGWLLTVYDTYFIRRYDPEKIRNLDFIFNFIHWISLRMLLLTIKLAERIR